MIREIIDNKNNTIVVVCKSIKDMEKIYNLLIENGVSDDEIINWTEDTNKLPHFEISKKYAKLLVNKISKIVPLFICKQ